MDKINKIEQMIDEIIKREGGYVNHPSDRGGPTRWGITQAVARANGYMGSMQDLPVDFARAVYRAEYYTKPRFDQIAALSPVLAQELFDTGVNCGVGFAKPLIQRALNLLNQNGAGGWPDLVVDGVLGNKTIDALKVYLSKRGVQGEAVLLKILNIMQGQRYIEIVERNPSQEAFFYGWIAHRVS